MSRELMQQALTALNTCDWDYDYDEESYKTFDEDLVNAAAAALKEALAKPDLSIEANRVAYDVAMHYANKTKEKLAKPEQASNEPPDYLEPPTSDYHNGWEEGFEAAKNLYPQKTKREWVGLTDDEVFEFLSCGVNGREDINNIEEALRRKNERN
jgi:hypothetical protein